MLVNASRFMDVQYQLRNAVHAHLDDMKRSIRVYGALPPEAAVMDPEIRALHAVWEREFHTTEFDWAEVQCLLHEAVSPIRVVEVNSRSPGTLDYSGNRQNGLNVIAVGGFSLSRGLTLEGLMVSYFLRNSMMYDTLMQMGRWFGYRPDYQDLCRIWMPEDAQGWYEHVAESIEELRSELRSMEASNATPEDFGLKVRGHPDTLIVTARNKMGTGARIAVRIGLAFRLIETHTLRRDHGGLEINRDAARKFAHRLGLFGFPVEAAEKDDFGFLLRRVPVSPILDFLSEFQNHIGSPLTDGETLKRYIEERADDELAEWDVLFASVGERFGKRTDETLGRPIRCQQRTAGKKSDAKTLLVSNRQRVSTRGIEKTGLSRKQRGLAERKYREDLNRNGKLTEGRPIHYPDWIYRENEDETPPDDPFDRNRDRRLRCPLRSACACMGYQFSGHQ